MLCFSASFPKWGVTILLFLRALMYEEKASFLVRICYSYHHTAVVLHTSCSVDPSVIRDLQAHRSLDDTLGIGGHHTNGA
jgi:hypothetical protein